MKNNIPKDSTENHNTIQNCFNLGNSIHRFLRTEEYWDHISIASIINKLHMSIYTKVGFEYIKSCNWFIPMKTLGIVYYFI